jgi:hypothetical protein
MEYYNGVPISSGVAAAESKFKNHWLISYNAGENTHFNRVTRIVKAVNRLVNEGTRHSRRY